MCFWRKNFTFIQAHSPSSPLKQLLTHLEQLQYASLWTGGGKTQGGGDAAREQKRPERELDQQWRTQQKPRPQREGMVQETLES